MGEGEVAIPCHERLCSDSLAVRFFTILYWWFFSLLCLPLFNAIVEPIPRVSSVHGMVFKNYNQIAITLFFS